MEREPRIHNRVRQNSQGGKVRTKFTNFIIARGQIIKAGYSKMSLLSKLTASVMCAFVLFLQVLNFSPWLHGFIEGLVDADLTTARSGRCRLDNPRAVLESGGSVLRMGHVNVPGKGVQEHIWGYDEDGRLVDVVCPDAIPTCRETRNNVFGEIVIDEDGNVKTFWNRGNPKHIDRIAGILFGQRVSGKL